MKRISEALGLGGEAEYYKKETDFIVDLLGESLMSKDAPDGPRDCACYALCAAYGLCGVSDEFVTLIQNSGADAVGSPSALYHVMSALCAAGRSDDAYRLLEKFAGHNDAYSPYCYEWMASYSAGINPAEPGYRKISVTPYLTDSLESTQLNFRSVSGMIKVRWSRAENGFELSVTVPPNTSATVSVPGGLLVRSDKQRPANSIECRSGAYTFTVIRERREP